MSAPVQVLVVGFDEPAFSGQVLAELEQLRRSLLRAAETLQARATAECRSRQALAASERRFRRLAESGNVTLWRADPDVANRSHTAVIAPRTASSGSEVIATRRAPSGSSGPGM